MYLAVCPARSRTLTALSLERCPIETSSHSGGSRSPQNLNFIYEEFFLLGIGEFVGGEIREYISWRFIGDFIVEFNEVLIGINEEWKVFWGLG